MRTARHRLVAAALIAFVVAMIVTTTSHADPLAIDIDGPPRCRARELGEFLVEQGDLPARPDWEEFKIDEMPGNEVYTDGVVTITITNATNTSFDWSSNIGIDAVYVKSGQGGSVVYLYDPPAEATSGEGLSTRDEKDISHVTFCYDEESPPTTSTTGSTSTSSTSTSTSSTSTSSTSTSSTSTSSTSTSSTSTSSTSTTSSTSSTTSTTSGTSPTSVTNTTSTTAPTTSTTSTTLQTLATVAETGPQVEAQVLAATPLAQAIAATPSFTG